MKKVPVVSTQNLPKKTNDFCPQTLYVYGTYKEDGTPNFGLFCWFSYCWDGELCVMASIGGEKLTKDRIHAGKVFSANLVTEELLPLADWFGSNDGYITDKSLVKAEIEKGSVLNVPVLSNSPWIFELEVKQSIRLDGGEIFICRIANVLADERLVDERASVEERLELLSPVLAMGIERYAALKPGILGKWGGWKDAGKDISPALF
jgi:flavin reductase (DIM6/NTAB) family NADH-FMN oxidoreductase RutF